MGGHHEGNEKYNILPYPPLAGTRHTFTFACFLQDGWGYDFRRNLSVAWEDYGHYATDLFTDEAVSIIQKHSDAANASPLFLYLAHLAVHSAK